MKEKKMLYLPTNTINLTLDYINELRRLGKKTNFSEIVSNALEYYIASDRRKRRVKK